MQARSHRLFHNQPQWHPANSLLALGTQKQWPLLGCTKTYGASTSTSQKRITALSNYLFQISYERVIIEHLRTAGCND